MPLNPFCDSLSTLFSGSDRAYGEYITSGNTSTKGKADGHGITHPGGPATRDHWDLHLKGKQRLGIIPINSQLNVRFGAIDIDEYQSDLKYIIKTISQRKWPLIACRSKSGGLHLYVFFKDWVKAKLVKRKLEEIAGELNRSGAEIFPKQEDLKLEQGDVGNWINMPYFDVDNTVVYAYSEHGIKLSIKQFVDLAERSMVSAEAFLSLEVTKSGVLYEGPPCLNYLLREGVGEGHRNNTAVMIGIYAKKKGDVPYDEYVRMINEKYFRPPLRESELKGTVFKSLGHPTKKYSYLCKLSPFKDCCQLALCRLQKFGVGLKSEGLPVAGSLSVFDGDPVIMFVDVEGGGRLELTPHELRKQDKYADRVFETFRINVRGMKREVWEELVDKILENHTVIKQPKDTTPKGLFFELLEDFCTSKTCKSWEELFRGGRPLTDAYHHYFRLRDLAEYCRRRKFEKFGMHQMAVYLKDIGGSNTVRRVKNKQLNIWQIPAYEYDEAALQIPKEIKQNEAF